MSTLTRKIQIVPIDIRQSEAKESKEEIDRVWSIMRKYDNTVYKMYNDVIREQYLVELWKENYSNGSIELGEINEQFKGLDKNSDDYKLLKLKKISLNKDIMEEVKSHYNVNSKPMISYNFLKKRYKGIVQATIFNSVNTLACKKMDNVYFNINMGKEQLPYYKKGCPIPFMGNCLKFSKIGDDYIFNFLDKMNFKLIFNWKNEMNGLKMEFERVYNKTEGYKFCESSIQIKDKKIYLLLVMKIPDKVQIFDQTKVLGVDLGLSIPVYCAPNIGYSRYPLGSYNDLTKVRYQMNDRLNHAKSRVRMVNGGKGRKHKLSSIESLYNKEQQFVSSYLHKLSRKVIDAAIKENCGVIHLELLDGINENLKNDNKKFLIRFWSYAKLQTFIEYKAKKEGIIVKYIDPYHTSQECSYCGHWEEGQRKNQKEFLCKNPSCSNKKDGKNVIVNADYNAARNIANSQMFVITKKDTKMGKINNDNNLVLAV